MDKKQIEIEINKLFIKHAIRSNRPLPELLYEDIFNLITKAIQVQAKVKPESGEALNCPFCGEKPEQYTIGRPHELQDMVRCMNGKCCLWNHPFYLYKWNDRFSV